MVTIKNYSMPHNCYDCDLHNYHDCDLTTESIEEDYCWNGDSREKHCPLREVEAIPKAEVKKFLEEGTKDVSNKVLAIVREDYIHKSVYEARLKADMVTMLEELKKEMNPIKECEHQIYGKEHWGFVGKCQDVIQQKINELKAESEYKE